MHWARKMLRTNGKESSTLEVSDENLPWMVRRFKVSKGYQNEQLKVTTYTGMFNAVHDVVKSPSGYLFTI